MTKVLKVVRKTAVDDSAYFEHGYLTRLRMVLIREQDLRVISNLNINPEYDLKTINGKVVGRYTPLATFICHGVQYASREVALGWVDTSNDLEKHLIYFFTQQYGIEVIHPHDYFRPMKRQSKK